MINIVSALKYTNLQIRLLFNQLIGSKNSCRACSNNSNIILFHFSSLHMKK